MLWRGYVGQKDGCAHVSSALGSALSQTHPCFLRHRKNCHSLLSLAVISCDEATTVVDTTHVVSGANSVATAHGRLGESVAAERAASLDSRCQQCGDHRWA